MVTIPLDWALYQTYLTGELVHEIFMSTILDQLVKDLDLGLLDINTCIALEQLANVMATAYSNAVHLKIDMVRYNDTLDNEQPHPLSLIPVVESLSASQQARPLNGGPTGRTSIQVQMGWSPPVVSIYPQHGFSKEESFSNLDPEDAFSPEVSVALNGDAGRNITTSLQRTGIIISAALRVMHPDLYWTGMETQVRLGKWAARYELDEMNYRHVSAGRHGLYESRDQVSI
ncbi:hypothetical protein CY34DRAFT_14548 [Suillus luteus UH-Slu-Lm8-n1]|uniref:Uncharacterized protein n=1 Tax=Suillus luteus UH-Slu-Lm8-n1 TaxID=930992 RepID=A0A0D0B5R9_9AGAM|nr:hypothetical protein CY34DRAFT_14548 [Suillus luteus UH-Slu-Lm8-n1]